MLVQNFLVTGDRGILCISTSIQEAFVSRRGLIWIHIDKCDLLFLGLPGGEEQYQFDQQSVAKQAKMLLNTFAQ